MSTQERLDQLVVRLQEARRACGSREQLEQWHRDVEAVSLAMSIPLSVLKAYGVEEEK